MATKFSKLKFIAGPKETENQGIQIKQAPVPLE